jgi:hypothetical protein
MADPQRAEAGSLRHDLRAANVVKSTPYTARADIRQHPATPAGAPDQGRRLGIHRPRRLGLLDSPQVRR